MSCIVWAINMHITHVGYQIMTIEANGASQSNALRIRSVRYAPPEDSSFAHSAVKFAMHPK